MNHKNTNYDSETFVSKMKGYLLLVLYTLIAAFITIVTIDLLVFPVTIFAVKKTVQFTKIIELIIEYGIIAYLLISITLNLVKNIRNGLTPKEILQIMVAGPLKKTSIFIILLIITAGILVLLFNILSKNYMLLNTITG